MSLVLDRLREPAVARDAAARACAMMEELFPFCRSITGQGVRQTLDVLGRHIDLLRHEVPSGTPVFDWEVPKEWNVRDACIADVSGQRLVDFRASNLHLVSYSAPVRARLSLEELQPHLHSLPDHPDWIPYRTTYYREDWGFCLRHRDRERLGTGPFDVMVDTDLQPGHLSYAEAVVPGTTGGEAIVYTHTCHPSLANDNLSGIVAAAALAREMAGRQPRLTWRFVFGPGTIGSLTWLARNEARLANVQAGLVIGLLGDAAPLTYKRSRLGGTATDRAVEWVLGQSAASRTVDFEPYGYDERQFCSPGLDLPVGRLTRSPNGAYPQYHTSADNLSLTSPDRLAEALQVLAYAIGVIDANRRPVNQSPKGEPRLGKRGLYGAVGGAGPGQAEHAMLWTLSLGDGRHDLVDIAARSGMAFELLDEAARALEQAGLVRSGNARGAMHDGGTST